MKKPAIPLMVFTACAAPALAGGIDFASMPKGCRWTIEYSDGTVWVETFMGRINGVYVTEVRNGTAEGPLVSRKKHNKGGWMTERVWATGKWERFEPYSCFGDIGSCTYIYTNADGQRDVMVNETTKIGETYRVRGKVKDGARFPDEKFTLGLFGVAISNRSDNYSARVTEFTHCEGPLS